MVAATATMSGVDIRRLSRSADFTGQTSGVAAGYVQCNVVILPRDTADHFAQFCALNPKPCPLLSVSPEPGDYRLPDLGEDIDIRRDVPRYRIWRDGIFTEQCESIEQLWQQDWVAFALGCSFSFEEALIKSGIEVRNISEQCNVPMYRTNIDCTPAGPFEGKLVVSMRPMPASDAIEAIQICGRYPRVHGAPVHFGDPGLIGIADLQQPDFGDAVSVRPEDVPVFWACGVTPQVALEAAELPLAITHEPGHMLVTDLKNEELAGPL